MKQHVIKVCQTAYYELKRVSSIRSYVTEDATKKLVTSCVLSRLDYCNSLLMGTPYSVIQPMQKVQNAAALLILRAPRHQHCTPPPTATSLTSDFWTHQIQNCLSVFQLNHWFRPLLPFWTTAAVQPFPLSPLFIWHTHTQTPTLQLQLLMAFALSPISVLISRTTSHKMSDTLILPFPSKTNSRHFSSLSISTEYYYASPQQSV